MTSRRDQLQAYQFLVQRAVSALVTRETDPLQPPFRRSTGALVGGILLALLALAGFGVYGVIVPGGNTSWRTQSAVIVEKETGTRYVYLDGQLHPVTNYVSALLVLGQHSPTLSVSRDSLTGAPRGPLLGIPDAPDALPGPDRLLTGSWSLCSAPATDASGSPIEQSVLLAGASAAGGSGLADRALLVQLASTGDRYLIWHGYRHHIDDYGSVGTGLALTNQPWATVDQAWLDVLPAGAPLGPIAVPQAGTVSTAVPGDSDIRVGMLLAVHTNGGSQQYYLAGPDALRPITEAQYDIQRAYPQTMAAYPSGTPTAMSLDPSLAAAARTLDSSATAAGGVPGARPAIAGLSDAATTVCATFAPGGSVPQLTVGPTLPGPLSATQSRSGTGTPLADRVYVPPGAAVLVDAMPAPNAPSGTVEVVTDEGRCYPLASPDALKTLGYDAAQPVKLPAGLVARLPQGPGLNPAAAARQPIG
ncbi:type VII secretion protein EccB [Kutzneria sp. CA-103260]|uniref:type VII secretion protein EccB n=1 Tax=Kutzneria sp. CA-103260 TaxID=2802641 RepID=UPI001BABB84A|nr:type VII secretion protein EccB [Kutzneria sp. CA-103260]QUQ67159.1 type VII secretion protein EccB [Kutzneria sp. CA-103260]